MATDKYWDGTSGDDTNSGSSGSKWKTFGGAAPAAFLAAMTSGDRAILMGTFRPTLATLNTYSLLSLTGRTGAQVIQNSGQTQAVLRADAPLVAIVWTQVLATDEWLATLPTGLGSPSGMTVAYDASTWTGQNSQSLNYGICRPVALFTDVAGTPSSFFYNSATGATRLNSPGANPNVATVTMVRAGTDNLVSLDTCTGCTIQGLDIRLIGINKTGGGYGIGIVSGTSCVIDSNRVADVGDHGIAFLGATNSGNSQTSNTVLGGGPTYTNFVTASTGAGDVTGFSSSGNRAHVVGYRDMANGNNYTPTTMGGFFGHCTSTGQIADAGYSLDGAYVYMPTAGATFGGDKMFGWGATNVADYAGAWDSTVGRKLRYADCFSRGDTGMAIDHAALFQRGSYQFVNSGNALPAQASFMNLTGGGGTTTKCIPLFQYCDLIANMARESGGGNEIGIRTIAGTWKAAEGPGFMGCAILNTDVNGENPAFLFDYNGKANAVIRAYGCQLGAVGGTNMNLCTGDTSLPASVHIFRSCAYIGISASGHSDNTGATLNTWAGWNTNVDTTGALRIIDSTEIGLLYSNDPGSPGDDTNPSSALAAGSPLRSSIAPASIPAIVSLTTLGDHGDYGAYQYADAQYARPTATNAHTGWLNQASSATNLHLSVDEAVVDDSDYVSGEFNAQPLNFTLGSVSDPAGNVNHFIHVRYRYHSGTANFTLTIKLKQNTTTKATFTRTVDVSTAEWIDYIATLSSGQADSITDYSILHLEFQNTITDGDEVVDIAQCFVEVPAVSQVNAPRMIQYAQSVWS